MSYLSQRSLCAIQKSSALQDNVIHLAMKVMELEEARDEGELTDVGLVVLAALQQDLAIGWAEHSYREYLFQGTDRGQAYVRLDKNS